MTTTENDPSQILHCQATEKFDKATMEKVGDWMKLTYNRYAKRRVRSAYMIFGGTWRSGGLFGTWVLQCQRGHDVYVTLKLVAVYAIWGMENRRDDFTFYDYPVIDIYSFHAHRFIFGYDVARESVFQGPEFDSTTLHDWPCKGFGNVTLAILAKCGLLKDIRLPTLRADLARAIELAGDTSITYDELPDLLDEVCDFLDDMFED